MSTNGEIGGRRVALVSGAARGIGAAAALALAQRGIVPALLVRDPAAAEGVAAQLREAGAAFVVERCDVTDLAAVRRAVAAVAEAGGRIDAVVNNAGRIDPIGLLADTDPADWALAFQTNVIGAYHLVREALPRFAEGEGTIVNVSTGAAHNPREGWSAYCASKAALAMLTRCVHTEYGAAGVRCYGLQPGLVDTEMQVQIRAAGFNEISRIPRSQLDGPQRSAAAIAWLADQRPPELAGQDFPIGHPALQQFA